MVMSPDLEPGPAVLDSLGVRLAHLVRGRVLLMGPVPRPLVRGILTDVGMTLAEAAAALERGEDLPLTDVQRRMVETWAVEHAQ